MDDEHYEKIFKPFPYQLADNILKFTNDERIRQIIHDYKTFHDVFQIIYRDNVEQSVTIQRLQAEIRLLQDIINFAEL